MNINKVKKVRVRFPNILSLKMAVEDSTKLVQKFREIQDINNRIYSELFTQQSTVQIGSRMLPKIEGFNATWINNERPMGAYVDVQFTFASSEESKVMKIIQKHSGQIIDVRKDLHQFAQTETNNSNTGKEYEIERAEEILQAKDFE